MKILQIEVFSPNFEHLRTVKFKETGLSAIYGDVQPPKKRMTLQTVLEKLFF